MMTLQKAVDSAPTLELEAYPISGDMIARMRDAGREPQDINIWTIVADESAITHHCGVQTYAGSYYLDPEPPEYCEVQVDEEGQLCAAHDIDDE